MTDAELAEWLGFKGEPRGIEYVQALEPKKRQLFERMHKLERDLSAATHGSLLPLADLQGVLIDRNRRR